jgi:hypothetical protein
VNQPVVAKRITAAREYFKKYRTPSGGWDIGNAGPLDTIVLPRAFPTAIVLMALAKIAPDDIQTDDLDGLRRDLEGDKSILSLSVGLLALRSVGGEAEDIATRITQRQMVNGSWENNPYSTAWATLALNGAL